MSAGCESALIRAVDAAVDAAGPLDALLLAVHGAAVGQTHADFDARWVGRVCDRVGDALPIAATLDLHANVSPALLARLDAAAVYRTNPHLDQAETGRRAIRLLRRRVEGGSRPAVAHAALPMALNIERQLTDEPPLRDWLAWGAELEDEPGVWSAELAVGYPYADVPEMGLSLFLQGDADPAELSRLAGDWARRIWADRERARPTLIGVEQAARLAADSPGATGLLDMGDNVGAGSPGRSTHLAHALRGEGVGAWFVNLVDPAALRRTFDAGVGGAFDAEVGGGGSTEPHSRLLRFRGGVRALTDGRWIDETPRADGRTRYDEGPQALVESEDGSVIQLSGATVFPASLGQLEHAGLRAERFRALVIKCVHAPTAAYRDVTDQLIRVDSPGVTEAGLSDKSYRLRRRPMFPFEGFTDRDAPWTVWSSGA